MECPKCGSTRIVKAGFAVTRQHGRRQRYKCQDRGHIFFKKVRQEY